MGRTNTDEAARWGTGNLATAWNKEQAELLRGIALAGGIYDADKCQGTTVDALIEAGFATMEPTGRVTLTDAGLARARELRPGSRQ